MNIFILFGTLVEASEVKTTQKGTEYCSISVQTIENKKQRDGNIKEEISVIPKITIWGHNAKVAAESIGNKILLRGKITSREGTGQWSGKKFTEFQAEHVSIFGKDEDVGEEGVPF